ncbi:mitochondrial 40s ribosomal protein [Flagelloscypha sp. PMI_526]|nr:mitochondrial 40s ribosomal protein [Flagelloscypha sp. PMI_526]
MSLASQGYQALSGYGAGPKYGWRILRDIKVRRGVTETEAQRRALLYIARNTTLPAPLRHSATLELNRFTRHTHPTAVKNRCHETGRGRGVMREFGLCRHEFRMKALAGELNGVIKASW